MKLQNFSYHEFTQFENVSRETFIRLNCFVELLQKWQQTINLISATTLPDIWTRHIIDSTQLYQKIGANEAVVDMGSGAGFPGMVLGIMGITSMALVESDGRKVAFLREVARETKTPIRIFHERAENVSLTDFSVITARGFASVKNTLNFLKDGLNSGHKLLLLKGKSYQKELGEAREDWSFDCETFPSITDKEGVILSITNLKTRSSA